MPAFAAISRSLMRLLPKTKVARIVMTAVVATSATLGSFASLNVAQASAYGCTGYGWIKVPFTHVSSSRWCGQINGNGLSVTSVQGSFFSLIAGVYLCNTSMKAEFFDAFGRSIGTFYSPVTKGCLQAGGTFYIPAHGTMPNEGHIDMTLMSYGADLATVREDFKYAKPAPTPAPTPTKVITSPAVLTPANLKTSTTVVSTPAPLAAPLAASSYVPVATTTPIPVEQPAPAPAPAASYAETAGGTAHTWTNYSNAGGYEGATIGGGQTVAVACKVSGFRVADGNTWWYRLASSPWNGAYYVSADAFYNNGRTSGSLAGTPYVDLNVPNC